MDRLTYRNIENEAEKIASPKYRHQREKKSGSKQNPNELNCVSM